MLNQCVLVGRFKEFKNDVLTIAVNSCMKNAKGEYETYIINVIVKEQLAKSVREYCHKGDIIGLKAMVVTGNKLICEKISFLSSKHNK